MPIVKRYYIRDAETNELWCIPVDSTGIVAR